MITNKIIPSVNYNYWFKRFNISSPFYHLLYKRGKKIFKDNTMDAKLIHILNDKKQNYPSVDYNHWFKSWNISSLEPTDQKLKK